MKRFIVLSLVMLFVVIVSGGFYLHTSSATQAFARTGTQQWEYKVVPTIDAAIAAGTSGAKDPMSALTSMSQELQKLFNSLGMSGWELVSMGEGIAVFKKLRGV